MHVDPLRGKKRVDRLKINVGDEHVPFESENLEVGAGKHCHEITFERQTSV